MPHATVGGTTPHAHMRGLRSVESQRAMLALRCLARSENNAVPRTTTCTCDRGVPPTCPHAGCEERRVAAPHFGVALFWRCVVGTERGAEFAVIHCVPLPSPAFQLPAVVSNRVWPIASVQSCVSGHVCPILFPIVCTFQSGPIVAPLRVDLLIGVAPGSFTIQRSLMAPGCETHFGPTRVG